MIEDRPYTPAQVADLFSVSIQTVRAWADSGYLPHFRTPGGKRRFHRSDIDALRASQLGRNEASA